MQVCLGLAAAHSETPPIVHRDIKPQNVLVGYDANGLRVRISDFGLATRVDPVTFMVTARGTLPFKAPETRALAAARHISAVSGIPLTDFALSSTGNADAPFPDTPDARAHNRTVTLTLAVLEEGPRTAGSG